MFRLSHLTRREHGVQVYEYTSDSYGVLCILRTSKSYASCTPYGQPHSVRSIVFTKQTEQMKMIRRISQALAQRYDECEDDERMMRG